MKAGRKARPGVVGFHLPFLIGDALLLVTAGLLFAQGNRPLHGYEVAAIGFCVALGAGLGVWPWVLRHRAAVRRMETEELKDAVARVQKIGEVARQVEIATNKWQTAQDAADRTTQAAQNMAREMAEREADFREFLKQANDTERQHLRLEVQKLRQSEATWLKVLIFMLDHTHALLTAAERSNQPKVAHEIGRFQHACLDAARRVGLARLDAPAGTPFDAERHDLPEPEKAAAAEGAVVVALLAPGYSFQGRILRKPLVTLKPLPPPEPAPNPDPAPDSAGFTVSDGPETTSAEPEKIPEAERAPGAPPENPADPAAASPAPKDAPAAPESPRKFPPGDAPSAEDGEEDADDDDSVPSPS